MLNLACLLSSALPIVPLAALEFAAFESVDFSVGLSITLSIALSEDFSFLIVPLLDESSRRLTGFGARTRVLAGCCFFTAQSH